MTEPQLKGTKAIVAALIAVLATFLTSIAAADHFTWQGCVGALAAAVIAHQGVYRTTNQPRSQHRQ